MNSTLILENSSRPSNDANTAFHVWIDFNMELILNEMDKCTNHTTVTE